MALKNYYVVVQLRYLPKTLNDQMSFILLFILFCLTFAHDSILLKLASCFIIRSNIVGVHSFICYTHFKPVQSHWGG